MAEHSNNIDRVNEDIAKTKANWVTPGPTSDAYIRVAHTHSAHSPEEPTTERCLELALGLNHGELMYLLANVLYERGHFAAADAFMKESAEVNEGSSGIHAKAMIEAGFPEGNETQ